MFYLLLWRYLKVKSSQHMAQKKRSTREVLGLILKINTWVRYLCTNLALGDGRNFNEPVLKNLTDWGVAQGRGYLGEHVEAFN